MARNVNPETLALSRRFIKQYGHGIISVDQLDAFFTDEGIVPQLDFDRDEIINNGNQLTVEQKASWDGFIAARQKGRDLLARGGKQLVNGEAFALRTLKSGSTYEVKKFTDSAKDYADKEMVEKVQTYARNRLGEFRSVANQLDRLFKETPLEDLTPDLLEVRQMYKTLDTSAAMLTKHVEARVKQYNLAVEAATEQARLLIAAHSDDANRLLEHQIETETEPETETDD